ncbi:MAG: DUF5666 domain-containing protein [Pseudomonadota bacterium]
MNLKHPIAAIVAVVSLGLAACAPISNPADKAAAQAGKIAVAIKAKADAVGVASQNVTLYKVEMSTTGGAPVTVFDNATGLQVNLADLKTQVKTVINVQSVPDGTYTSLAVTLAKDTSVAPKTITVSMNITVAAGQITTVTVSMDPAKVADVVNGGAQEGSISADDDDDVSATDDQAYLEGKITAIADDKSSFTFALEHSNDPAANTLTVNIDANTQLVGEHGDAVLTADQLVVGDEVEVEGSADAVTHIITATRVEVEHADRQQIPMDANAVKLMGTITSIAADATSITVKVGFAKGALSAEVTDVEVTIVATTKIVKTGNEKTVADLSVGDKVFVRGALDAGKVNAELIVVKPDQSAIPHTQHVGEVRGVVSLLDTMAKTFTLTTQEMDIGNMPVTVVVVYSDATLMKDFAADAPLTNDQKVEVYGEKNADGQLVATKIEFKPAHVEKQGIVGAIAVDAKTFMLEITLADATTESVSVDYTNAHMRHFADTALAAGQNVRVEGAMNAAGDVLMATEIKLDAAPLYSL